MTQNDFHDLDEEALDPFHSLIERVRSLKKGDDGALLEIAKAAAEANLSKARLEALKQEAKRPTGFIIKIIRDVFDEAEAKHQATKRRAVEAARKAAGEAAREADREALWRKCRDLALAPNLLNEMERTAHRLGFFGESAGVRGSYLAMTSRLLRSNAISLLRRGAPAGGKNYLFDNVTPLMPEESVIRISSASPMALIYLGDNEDALKHKIIVIAEAAAITQKSNGDEHPMTVMLRTLLSEGQIDRMVTIPQRDGPPQTVHVKRNGPVSLMLTSARENVDQEMLTRLMTSDADESREQTLAVVERRWESVAVGARQERSGALA